MVRYWIRVSYNMANYDNTLQTILYFTFNEIFKLTNKSYDRLAHVYIYVLLVLLLVYCISCKGIYIMNVMLKKKHTLNSAIKFFSSNGWAIAPNRWAMRHLVCILSRKFAANITFDFVFHRVHYKARNTICLHIVPLCTQPFPIIHLALHTKGCSSSVGLPACLFLLTWSPDYIAITCKPGGYTS